MYTRILALDIGDVWTGIAISDPLGIIARPLTTIKTESIIAECATLVAEHGCKKIVVGRPITCKGSESSQTIKTEATVNSLKEALPEIEFIWRDERFSSQRVKKPRQRETKEGKLAEHARAAADILDMYLTSLRPVF